MASEILITPYGRKKMEDELYVLKTTVRQEVVEAIRVAKSFGDLSENSEYEHAREWERKNEAKIQELEEKLRNLYVIDWQPGSPISVGCTVVLKKKADGSEIFYHVVGEPEADPFKRLVSDKSPIGSILFGRTVGDVVTFRGADMEIVSVTKYEFE